MALFTSPETFLYLKRMGKVQDACLRIRGRSNKLTRMARKKTSTTDESTNVEVKPAKGSTERTKEFRAKLAASDTKRWELLTTSAISKEVRRIAKSEGMTASVAAEALLNLGIETYLATRSETVECEVVKPPSITDIFRNINQHSSTSSHASALICNPSNLNQTHPTQIKPLIQYSSRTTIPPLSEPARPGPLSEVVIKMPTSETSSLGHT